MITLKQLFNSFKIIADSDPRINNFITGPRYELLTDVKYYPYMAIIVDNPHTISYSDNNKYRAVEFNFVIRIADKVNNQVNPYKTTGLGSNNGMDISSDTFTILLDVINAISENTLGLFDEVSLVDDISAEPFYNEDSGDVNGYEAEITLRVKNSGVCHSPLTDNFIN